MSSQNTNYLDKHLNLCFTHVATGHCPYGNRCSFIHDPRISGEVKSKTKLKDFKTNDSLVYWPKNIKKSKSPNIEYEVSTIHEKDKYTKYIWNSFIKYISDDSYSTKENRNLNKNKDKLCDSLYKHKSRSYNISYKFKDKSNNDLHTSKNIRILKR